MNYVLIGTCFVKWILLMELFPLPCLRAVGYLACSYANNLDFHVWLPWHGTISSLLNFPAFPMFIISAPSLPPLTPLWLWSSSYLDLLILHHVHHCAINGLGSHRNPVLFLANTEILTEWFCFLQWISQKEVSDCSFTRKFCSLAPVPSFPHSCRHFCLAQLYLGMRMLANRTGRDLLWYNLGALWYNPFHKLFRLRSDWIVCFSGKGSESDIPLEETYFQFPD